MNARQYWNAFMDSGIPEYYLLYKKALKLEETHVPDNTGTGAASQPL